MTRRTLLRRFAALGVLAWLASCRRDAPPPREPGPVRAVVTIPPLAGLVRPLLPPEAEITVLIPPGQSEHGLELTPGDVRAISRADLVVYVGLGLEPQVERAIASTRSARPRRVVEFASSVGIEPEPHDHADHEGHDHGSIDPHLWLDPALVLALVPGLASNARAAASDAGAPGFAPDVEALRARIEEIDSRYRERLSSPALSRALVTQHAAFGRLARRYDLEIIGVVRPIEGMEPSPEHLSDLVRAMREHRVRAIFTEPQYASAATERLARGEGLRVERLDAIGNEDWFALMRANLDALERGLRDE